MAPRTRRSTGAANAIAAAIALDELQAAQQLQQKPVDPPKRRRGRPPKNQVSITIEGSSDSTPSAPTPLTLTTSDGEYSTPATSKAVTPAPPTKDTLDIPTSTSHPSNRPRRGRLTLELPPESDPDDDDYGDDGEKGTKLVASSTTVRPKRRRHDFSSGSDDSDEYDDLYGDDQSASAALARKLQREENQKASTTNLYIPVKRRTKVFSIASDSEIAEIDSMTFRRSKAKSSRVSLTNIRPRKRQKIAVNKLTGGSNSALNTDVDLDAEIKDGFGSLLDEDGSHSPSEASGSGPNDGGESESDDPTDAWVAPAILPRARSRIIRRREPGRRTINDRMRLEVNHPELNTMWKDLENMPDLNAGTATQPTTISLQLKPFQLQGLAWLKAMEKTPWKGGLLGDEMGLGKTIQAVSLIMSDYPAKMPTLVLLPPVALGQWQDEIATYTGDKLKTIVFHGTNTKAKNLTAKELKKFDVIIMSYNSLESLYRKQEKGIRRKDGLYKEKSIIHQTKFHRVILDEAHCIKVR